MKIQSLSVCVPTGTCVNNCAFCVSRMHNEDYPNMMDSHNPYYDLYLKDYIRRLEFARDNGCNTVMLTGTAEPQQNMVFLREFGNMNQNLTQPFRWIEIQTTGVLMDRNTLRLLRNHVGVSTVSMSLSSFDDDENQINNGTPEKLKVNIKEFCGLVKEYGFNLRLSLNMTHDFEEYGIETMFDYIKILQADQVTFRKLYFTQADTPQNNWVRKNCCNLGFIDRIESRVRTGTMLGKLEYGQEQWSYQGVSYVFDEDCMSKDVRAELKYLILRPNARLYSKWDDRASLVF